MAYLQSAAILTRIREVLTDGAGSVRTIPLGRFTGDLPEGLPEYAEEMRALGNARVEARIVSKRKSPASPPMSGNLRIYELRVEVRVVRLVEPLNQHDDKSRLALMALASDDGDYIAQALENPGALSETESGDATGLASGVLIYEGDSTSVVGRIADGAQTLSTVHNFRGYAISRPATA